MLYNRLETNRIKGKLLEKQNTTRLVWADSLKGSLILLVILGHAIQVVLGETCNNNHLWNLIYSFHMPAFVAISGYFSYQGSRTVIWGGYVRKRSIQLLIPFLIWSLISYIISENYTFYNLLSIVLYPDKYFWFLWILFWICLLFTSAKLLAQKIGFDELFVASLIEVALVACMIAFDIRVFGFQFLAYYFTFYLAGYCIRRFDFLKITNKWILLFLFVCWFTLGWCWNMHRLPWWLPENMLIPTALLQYTYRGVTALIASVLLLNVAPLLLNKESQPNETVCKIGEYSLGIYVCHLCIIGGIYKLMKYLIPFMPIELQILALFVASIPATLIIVDLLCRTHLTSKIFLGKTK